MLVRIVLVRLGFFVEVLFFCLLSSREVIGKFFICELVWFEFGVVVCGDVGERCRGVGYLGFVCGIEMCGVVFGLYSVFFFCGGCWRWDWVIWR